MSDRPGKTWAIEPHTRAKLDILRFYLQAWFPILSKGGFPRIVYIDGFAGPGRYAGGEEGSPLVALNAVLKQRLLLSCIIEFHFVELDPQCLARLEHEIESLRPELRQRPNVQVTIHKEQTFAEAYDRIRPSLGDGRRTVPTFALIDPFGWTGVPFGIVRDLLARKSTEVVFNFMHEDIKRFLGHDQQPTNFDALFGCSAWRDAIPLRGYERTYRLHDLFRKQLIDDAGARFVRSFTMVNDRHRVDYFLFFATSKLLGLKKMKEAMWHVDPTGEFQFSDATNPNAPSLFSGDADLKLLRQKLAQRFGVQWTLIDDLFDFATAETPFIPTHAKAFLREAEKANPASIEIASSYERRRGDFPEGRGIRIRFIGPRKS